MEQGEPLPCSVTEALWLCLINSTSNTRASHLFPSLDQTLICVTQKHLSSVLKSEHSSCTRTRKGLFKMYVLLRTMSRPLVLRQPWIKKKLCLVHGFQPKISSIRHLTSFWRSNRANKNKSRRGNWIYGLFAIVDMLFTTCSAQIFCSLSFLSRIPTVRGKPNLSSGDDPQEAQHQEGKFRFSRIWGISWPCLAPVDLSSAWFWRPLVVTVCFRSWCRRKSSAVDLCMQWNRSGLESAWWEKLYRIYRGTNPAPQNIHVNLWLLRPTRYLFVLVLLWKDVRSWPPVCVRLWASEGQMSAKTMVRTHPDPASCERRSRAFGQCHGVVSIFCSSQGASGWLFFPHNISHWPTCVQNLVLHFSREGENCFAEI